MESLHVVLQNVVYVLISIGRRVFIVPWGSSTDVASRPGGEASTNFLNPLGLPLLMQTRVQEAVDQTNIKPGRPGRYIPRVPLILVEFQISL
jgi:hypothetical protein